jgi:hypothetical protein
MSSTNSFGVFVFLLSTTATLFSFTRKAISPVAAHIFSTGSESRAEQRREEEGR